MTIEQKAQRYNEALKRAKKLYEQGTITESLSYVFPELRESDDERIRKWLICTLKSLNNSPVQIDGAYEMMLPAIAWLEKQGELKPAFEMKTPEESLGIDSDTYNKIVDECIYGEQKPADKVKPFDKYEGLTDFERTLADICIGWIGEEPGWEQYIKDNADVLLKIAIKKFNSVQDALFEQNPAWSEEDEKHFSWLIEYLSQSAGLYDNLIDWLKSLKDRYTWKPSDEQMYNLSEAAHYYCAFFSTDVLIGLYDDLKKLKG
jgi:hypothetical protein